MVRQEEQSDPRNPQPEGNPRRRSDRVPGYGWRPNLTGLERPRQWLAVFLGTILVLLVAALITYLTSL